MFGESGSRPPYFWLWILWLAVTLARLPPATYSQWEDPLFSLVTKVNAPWPVTLGFTGNNGDHILYDALSKIVISATHHRYLEFTYRIPSLVAGFLSMPLGYAVFSSIGGPLYGALFGICSALLPTFTLHADNARGYMVLLFALLWALGLSPGIKGRLMPVRLGIAYFLLGASHGLGLVLLFCFAVFGCFLGKHRQPRFTLLANAFLTIPAFLFNIPTISFLARFGSSVSSNNGVIHSFGFLPGWADYQFGTSLLPHFDIMFLALMTVGAIAAFRRSWQTGISLSAFMFAIPALFVVNRTSWVLPQYSMICMPFWLWAFFDGLTFTLGGLPKAWNAKRHAVIICFALLAALFPSLAEYLLYPQQNYTGVFEEIIRDFPDQKTIFGIAQADLTGLDYYSQRYGLRYRVIDTGNASADSAWRNAGVHCVIVSSENEVRTEALQWLKRNAVLVKTFKGTTLPASLYKMRGDFNPGK